MAAIEMSLTGIEGNLNSISAALWLLVGIVVAYCALRIIIEIGK